MKNLSKKRNLLLLFLSLTFIISCNKDEVQEELTQINQDPTDPVFFSNKATYDLLSPSTKNWAKDNSTVALREGKTDGLKSQIESTDIALDKSYINHLVQSLGYPFWDASYVFLFEKNGEELITTPIFKPGADRIDGVFTYSQFNDGTVIYNLMSRDEMNAEALNPKDPNFHFYTNVFADYDSDLFGLILDDYPTWEELKIGEDYCYTDLECYTTFIQPGDEGGPLTPTTPTLYECFIVCSSACTDELSNSGIVNTSEEEAWIFGNCSSARIINRFLENNNASDPAILG